MCKPSNGESVIIGSVRSLVLIWHGDSLERGSGCTSEVSRKATGRGNESAKDRISTFDIFLH